MGWRHIDGPELTVAVTIGATKIDAQTPVQYSGDTVVALTGSNHEEVAGVIHENGAANATKVKMDLLVPGSIWEVTEGLTGDTEINRGGLVYIKDADDVDEGSASDIAVGRVVNEKLTADSTTGQILILGGKITQ